MPRPVPHAAAAGLHGIGYLVGGRGEEQTSQTPDILAINPLSRKVTPARRLPKPLSDSAVVPIGNGLIAAGGTTSSATVAQVGRLLIAPGR